MTRAEVLVGDCIDMMRTLADSSVDSVVTDPPYELGFMGKSWDASGIAFRVDVWREALRVLKPGGHLLAFSGSRTYHRMACAIEDAGFEIRDQIMWVYAQGFPKSHDVSKAIDAAAGAVREVVGPMRYATRRTNENAGMYGETLARPDGMDTAPATPEAKRWQGWGTALKPAHEPIVVARKPLIGTVAQNVLAHGTGALNIDGCRVPMQEGDCWNVPQTIHGSPFGENSRHPTMRSEPHSSGRWPANLIHDGSEEIVGMFPDTGPAKRGERQPNGKFGTMAYGDFNGMPGRITGHEDAGGSAARFFYSAKASKADRDEGLEAINSGMLRRVNNGGLEHDAKWAPVVRKNIHPTVKPTDLMRYLCRLVTPPGGLVLDPFTGSGSTGKGAVLEGFRFIGIELSPEYANIARARIRHAVGHVAPEPVTEPEAPDALPGQLRLFA